MLDRLKRQRAQIRIENVLDAEKVEVQARPLVKAARDRPQGPAAV